MKTNVSVAKNTEPPKLMSITNVVADIEFTEHGASALCPNGRLVPLMQADGPVEVSVEQGHLKFGNVRHLRVLRPGQVMLVYNGRRLVFWTLLTWVRGAQAVIENHRAELARIAEEAQASQERSRVCGLRQRTRALTPRSRIEADHDVSLEPIGRGRLMNARDELDKVFGSLGDVFAGIDLPRELATT